MSVLVCPDSANIKWEGRYPSAPPACLCRGGYAHMPPCQRYAHAGTRIAQACGQDGTRRRPAQSRIEHMLQWRTSVFVSEMFFDGVASTIALAPRTNGTCLAYLALAFPNFGEFHSPTLRLVIPIDPAAKSAHNPWEFT